MKLIWATRGRFWGFRFLLDGDYADPLAAYEKAFTATEGDFSDCLRVGDVVALRFPDPLGRKDTAGRVIPHDFVVMEPLAGRIHSVEDGLEKVWPLVADMYAAVWDSAQPPTGMGSGPGDGRDEASR